MSNISKESGSGGKKGAKSWDDYNIAQFKVLVKAEKTIAMLQTNVPRFVKCMLPSNVESGFWMHIPTKFCRRYLPNHNSRIVLVDELGVEYKTCFKLKQCGLSAGWRKFSTSHNLKRGDILIFQLIGVCRIKVYVVPILDPEDVSNAISVLYLGGSRPMPEKKEGEDPEKIVKKKLKALMDVSFWLNNYFPPENNRKCTIRNCQLCI